MTERSEAMLADLRRDGGPPGAVAWAVEGACAEPCLPAFASCDIRPDPRAGFVPLFHYLYHDRILTQSIFAPAPNPHFLPIKAARAFVLGDLLGCCLGAGGRLQNWEPPPGQPWMEWDRPAGDQAASYALFREALALRRGVGRDFLVFGRLLRPLPLSGVETVAWTHGGQANEIASLEHATWQAPDGRIAVALANWTDRPRAAALDLGALGDRPRALHVGADGGTVALPAGRRVELLAPPHSCALLVMGG
jgi:hypothetical protein